MGVRRESGICCTCCAGLVLGLAHDGGHSLLSERFDPPFNSLPAGEGGVQMARGGDSPNSGGNILPIRILALDQPDLLRAAPPLELRRALPGRFEGFSHLAPNGLFRLVFRTEPWDRSASALFHAGRDVTSHSCAEGAIETGHHVDVKRLVCVGWTTDGLTWNA